MRILMISAAYKSNSFGGVATHVANLVTGLVEHFSDTTIHVITLRKSGGDFLRDPKGRLTEWKFKQETMPEFSGRRVVFDTMFDVAAKHWHEINADVIHAHDWDSACLGLMLRAAFGIPLILTVHRAPIEWRAFRFQEDAKDSLMEVLRAHDAVDHVITPSNASATILKQQGFNRVVVIPHGISKHLSSFPVDDSVLAKLGVPTTAKLIFCPSRADEHKDPVVFVRAASHLKKKQVMPDQQIACLIASDSEGDSHDEFASELRVIAELYGLVSGQDVFFCKPFSYGTELATVFQAADVVVIPSIRESFGLAVLDAFLFQKPVIARNNSGLAEIVQHRQNGLLFTTAKELAWSLDRLLRNQRLAENLGRRGRADVEYIYTVHRMAVAHRAVYSDVQTNRKEALAQRYGPRP